MAVRSTWASLSLFLISTKSSRSNTAWKIIVYYLMYIKEPGTQNWTTPSVLTVNRLMKLKFRLMSWWERSIPANFMKNCKLNYLLWLECSCSPLLLRRAYTCSATSGVAPVFSVFWSIKWFEGDWWYSWDSDLTAFLLLQTLFGQEPKRALL